MTYSYNDSIITAISNVFAEKRSNYNYDESVNPQSFQDPVNSASPQVKEIISRVLQAEKDKLYMKNPRSINDDILKIIKDVVQ